MRRPILYVALASGVVGTALLAALGAFVPNSASAVVEPDGIWVLQSCEDEDGTITVQEEPFRLEWVIDTGGATVRIVDMIGDDVMYEKTVLYSVLPDGGWRFSTAFSTTDYAVTQSTTTSLQLDRTGYTYAPGAMAGASPYPADAPAPPTQPPVPPRRYVFHR